MIGQPRVHRAVAEALDDGRPVVALESTIITHGLPRPDNLRVARRVEAIVTEGGGVPATIGVVGGVPLVGLDADQLEHLATAPGVAKLSVRDLAPAVATGADGGTTVAATALLAARAGIRVFATGGLGGVHREARGTWDESADLWALARTPIAVVCAGVKSILDVGATLERLESLGVGVVGYRTRSFPGFYLSDSGFPLDWSVEEPAQVARLLDAQSALGVAAAVIVANPLPPAEQLDPALHDRALSEGLALLTERGVAGKAVTPFLLEHLTAATGGASLRANIRLIERNAALAASIAIELSDVR